MKGAFDMWWVLIYLSPDATHGFQASSQLSANDISSLIVTVMMKHKQKEGGG